MEPPDSLPSWAARLRSASVGEWIAIGCLTLVIGLAWAWLAHDAGDMQAAAAMAAMPGMAPAGPVLFAAYVPSTFAMWLLMMAAMMLPAAAPFVLLHARFAARQAGAGGWPATAAFAGAYLGVWAAFSLAAALAQWALVRVGAVSAFALTVGDRRVAGLMLIAAGLYQLTPLKEACVQVCRTPLSFLMRYWRPGWRGALGLGLRHGLYCLGCCWAMMLLLFVGGVMNLAWIAGLALLVLIEKVAPFGRELGIAAGVAAIAAGGWLASGAQGL